MAYDLQTVDLLRERMGVGYAAAQEALAACDGDVVAALAHLENASGGPRDLSGVVQTVSQNVSEALHERRIRAVRIRVGDQLVADLTADIGGTEAAALVFIAAVLENLNIEFEYCDSERNSGEMEETSTATAEVSYG